MHTPRSPFILVGLIVLAGLIILPVVAAPSMQDGNLLQDPHFDLAAQGVWKWEYWSYQTEVIQPGGKNEPDLQQSFYTPVFQPSESKWDHESAGQSGAAGAISRSKPYAKFRAGFYQTVAVAAGTRVRFSIWANGFCQSGQGQCPFILKAGIDPAGGTDWSSGNIKWAATESATNKYVQLVTEEVTVGESGKVTVFTWGEPRDSALYIAAYFDDAALSAAGAPTSPAVATPAQQPGQLTATAQPTVCAQLRWVSDVTIPDNTAMAPGFQFVKTWSVKNTGSCVFSGTLNFIGTGNKMGGQSPVALPKIEAGQQANVSINLTAPAQAGDYQGTWQPRTDDGTPMENLVVRIKVSAEAATPVPGVTATPVLALTVAPATAITSTPAVSITATPQIQATPTPEASPTPATGQICILAYNDLNGDGQRGADESLLAGVLFLLSDANGQKDSYTTDSVSEPHCFTDLPLGNYQLTIKPPAGYATTTFDTLGVSLGGGIKPEIIYGAKRAGAAPAPTLVGGAANPSTTSGGLFGSTGRTVLIVMAILVLVVLGGAIGFALMGRRQRL